MTIKEALDILDDLITCEMEWSDFENEELQKAWNTIREDMKYYDSI